MLINIRLGAECGSAVDSLQGPDGQIFSVRATVSTPSYIYQHSFIITHETLLFCEDNCNDCLDDRDLVQRMLVCFVSMCVLYFDMNDVALFETFVHDDADIDVIL